MRRLLAAAAVPAAMILGEATAFDATGGAASQRGAKTETAHLSVTTGPTDARVVRGGRVALFADVAPKPRMHVYAPEQKDVIPVSLTLDRGEFEARPQRFPAAEKYFFPPLEETQLVYSKPFRIVQHVTIGAAARAGAVLTITGTLRYQACDDAICYMPVTVPVGWTVRVTG